MTPAQCRMARAALQLGVREIAVAAGVATETISRLERGETLRPRTMAAVRAAFEAAGVVFVSGNGGGPGVRLKEEVAGSTTAGPKSF